MWRLRPFTFLPASKPVIPLLFVVFTDWPSTMPALGLAWRPSRSRAATTRLLLIVRRGLPSRQP
jgi:hypothetical protein